MTIRSRQFGFAVLERIHVVAERLSQEHNPKKIVHLKETLDKLFDVWHKRAERRLVPRKSAGVAQR